MAPNYKLPTFLRALSWENIRFALVSIKAQKLRSFLTLLGIIVGVATVITMVSLVVGFNRSLMQAFESRGSNLVQIRKFDPVFADSIPPEQLRRPNLTINDVDLLKQSLTISKGVSPRRSVGNISIKNSRGDETLGPNITGVWPEYALVNNAEVEDGRFFASTDIYYATRTCVIGFDIVKSLFHRSDPIGREIYFNGVPMRVIGVLKSKGSVMGQSLDNLALIPLTTFDEMYPWVRLGRGETLRIDIAPLSVAHIPDLIDEATIVLRAARGLKPGEPNNFAVTSSDSQRAQQTQIINMIAAVMILIASIALIVGGVGVLNIMLVSVTERTREIGVRKALGATRKDIAAQFLVEAMTLTCVGGFVGIFMGYAGGALVTAISGGLFPASAPLWSVFLGFGVSAGVGITAGLIPAIKAARQDPIEALRYE